MERSQGGVRLEPEEQSPESLEGVVQRFVGPVPVWSLDDSTEGVNLDGFLLEVKVPALSASPDRSREDKDSGKIFGPEFGQLGDVLGKGHLFKKLSGLESLDQGADSHYSTFISARTPSESSRTSRTL